MLVVNDTGDHHIPNHAVQGRSLAHHVNSQHFTGMLGDFRQDIVSS